MEINKTTAKRLYPEAPEWMKKQLVSEFGQTTFVEKDFETIKTFEDACKKLGIDPSSVAYNSGTTDEIAYKKLKVIIAAINNGWTPDWNNGDQKKWFPWFTLSSGFGFSCSGFDWAGMNTNVGSRLCFETDEQATYAGNQFTELYREFLTITE